MKTILRYLWRDKVDLILWIIITTMLIVYMASGGEKNFTGMLLIVSGYIFYAMFRFGVYTDKWRKAQEGWDQCIKDHQECNETLEEALKTGQQAQDNFEELKRLMDGMVKK